MHSFLTRIAASLAGAALALIAFDGETRTETAALVFVAFYCGGLLVPRAAHWRPFLPLMGGLLPIAGVLAGVALLVAVSFATGLPALGAGEVAATALLVAVVSVAPQALARRGARARPVRVGVVGSSRAAELLSGELTLAGITSHQVVGRVASPGTAREGEGTSEISLLGSLECLSGLVEEHELDLLVVAQQADRERILDVVVASCMHLPVRLVQFSTFYEELFGHVPTADMSAAWFEYMLHPRYRWDAPAGKRILDLVLGTVLGLLSLPLLLALALLIRRDGGPALFRQTRVGEGGRPFTLLKLRTMTPEAAPSAQWASADDPRITRIGRFLRRTHLDEMPQFLNVVRGEMSLVGPRPEQPELTGRVEAIVPFYARRHLIRPGMTGWAQVLCGYANTEVSSVWKLSHDLYYLKHRSLAFDLVILAETARKVVLAPHLQSEPESVSFLLPVAKPAAAEAA